MKETIESVYMWCDVVLKFFLEKDPDFVFMQDLKQTLFTLKLKKNMKGLKALKKEIESEFIFELTAKDREKLSILLSNGQSFSDSRISQDIKNIINRGHIVNDNEYRLLESYVDRDLTDAEHINRMLIDYYVAKQKP